MRIGERKLKFIIQIVRENRKFCKPFSLIEPIVKYVFFSVDSKSMKTFSVVQNIDFP